jgi:uncharacterized protein YbjT (DUF2867 family)
MKVVLFGASGLVGHGALRACLRDDEVESVVAVVRRPLSVSHPKLQVVVHDDFTDFSSLSESFAGADACYFCLGVPSFGKSEAEYTVITQDYALAAARELLSLNDKGTFVYISGASADSASKTMWARVKGRTEDALLALPFRAYILRPGYIQPRNGARPRTRSSRVLAACVSPLYPLLHRIFPAYTTTTDDLGNAMLAVTRLEGKGPRILSGVQLGSV